jgi:hypothetical protein
MYYLFDAIANLGSPWNMVVLVVMLGSLAGVITTVVVQIGQYASHRADVNLKRDLVDRGLSVEEIERIVSAKPSGDAQPTCKQSAEVGASGSRG